MQAIKRWALLCTLCLCSALQPLQAQNATAEALRAQFAALREKGEGKIVDRPIYLRSTETSERMQGEVHALIDQPFDRLRQALGKGENWCAILILHLNNKYCRASTVNGRSTLVVGVGRKYDQPLTDVSWVRFDFRAPAAAADVLDLSLLAANGPLGTRDYRIVVTAVPYDDRQSLLRMSYAYAYGMAARLALQAYLATAGSSKVGFSIVGKGSDGQPERIGGVRGVLERNTMRYYLAIEAFVGADGMPPAQALKKSLNDWFSAAERYPEQLHEIDRETYVEMKLREVQRQATEAPPPD
jgi:hypothetical protein